MQIARARGLFARVAWSAESRPWRRSPIRSDVTSGSVNRKLRSLSALLAQALLAKALR
jgi:hypothetical protein